MTTREQATLSAPSSDEDEILEAVFRYQFEHNASDLKERAAAYALQLPEERDPGEEFLSRFEGHMPPVEGASRCAVSEGGIVHDKASGCVAILFTVTAIRRISESEAEVRGGYLEGSKSGAGGVFRVVREDGRWSVARDRMTWIS